MRAWRMRASGLVTEMIYMDGGAYRKGITVTAPICARVRFSMAGERDRGVLLQKCAATSSETTHLVRFSRGQSPTVGGFSPADAIRSLWACFGSPTVGSASQLGLNRELLEKERGNRLFEGWRTACIRKGLDVCHA